MNDLDFDFDDDNDFAPPIYNRNLDLQLDNTGHRSSLPIIQGHNLHDTRQNNNRQNPNNRQNNNNMQNNNSGNLRNSSSLANSGYSNSTIHVTNTESNIEAQLMQNNIFRARLHNNWKSNS